MKKFELTYNNIVSVLKASERSRSCKIKNGKVVSYYIAYYVRPSEENKLNVSELIEQHNEDGSVEWVFYTRYRISRGHEFQVRSL